MLDVNALFPKLVQGFLYEIGDFFDRVEEGVFTSVYSFRQPGYFNLNLLKCGANCLKSLKKLFFNDSYLLSTRILTHFSNMLGGENPGCLGFWTLRGQRSRVEYTES